MDVGAAWTLLSTNIKTTDISSSASVRTVISQFLATPNVGVGIYDREGTLVGSDTTRTVTLTRTSGAGGKPVTYNLSWVGNDGTFSSQNSVALPLNTPVAVDVQVNPTSAGVHSAILNVDDPTTTGIDYQVMNTVVAVDNFAAPNYSITYGGSADRPDKATFFFRVPEGTPAFKLDETTLNGGRVRLLRFHPYGVGLDNATAGYQTGGVADEDDGTTARRRVGSHGRHLSHVAGVAFDLQSRRQHPGRNCFAESGHHRERYGWRAGRTFVHHHEPVRRIHGPRGRDIARQRVRGDAEHHNRRRPAL